MRRRFSGLSLTTLGNRLFRRPKQSPPAPHSNPFARRLRCEPLEDRRMLSITLFVDADAAPSGDGLAWGTAYNDLQAALDQAATYNTDTIGTNNVDQIWIAEGTYKPTAELEPGDARSASFSLLDGVTLYGGFEGTESTLEERNVDLAVHEAVLSGNLGIYDDNSDNAYTVVYCGENIEATIDGVSITGGNADGPYDLAYPGTLGGGIYNSGTLKIKNSTLSGNSASYGGAISNYSNNITATLTVTNSTLSRNLASNDGGGIFSNSTLTVTNSTLSGNSASNNGGGIFSNRTLTVTNSTLSGNSASINGGGIWNNASSATLNNTIVAGNVALTKPDISGEFAGIHNLIGDGSGQTSLVNGENGNIVGTLENLIDPLLGPLQDNGGLTLTQDLQPGSLAINAGSDTEATDPLGYPLLTDQRGFFRQFETVDIGAVEFQPPGIPVAYDDLFGLDQDGSLLLDVLANDFCNDGSPMAVEIVDGPRHGKLANNLDGTVTYTPEGTFWGNDTFRYRAVNDSLESNVAEVFLSVESPLSIIVTTAVDEQDGDLSSDDISLREALVDLAGSQIQFASNLSYQVIVLTMGSLNVSDVQIVGLGSNLLSIDGHSTAFNVTDGYSIISQILVTGGKGIAVATEATLLVDQVIVSNNTNNGIYNNGRLTITNSMLLNNSAYSRGGGIYNFGTLKAINCTFSGNSANYGGGIYNSGGKMAIANCTFSGNSALQGGGIYTSYGKLTITNCTLSVNSAFFSGGGIYIFGSSTATTLNNTTIAGNMAMPGSDIYHFSGTLTGSNNLIGSGFGQTSFVNGVNGNIVGTTENPIDPLLGPLQDNGGPTLTHALLPYSPLIDAGSDEAAIDLLGLPLGTDQRGFLRHFRTVDIGAVEYQPPGLPVAYDDWFELDQGCSLVADILANDVCNDGSPLIIEIVDGPQHGAFAANPDGTYIYTPLDTFWGTDTFSYRTINGSLESNVAEVFLSVVSPQSIVVTTAVDEQDGDLSSEDISLREALVDLAASQIQFSPHLLDRTIVLTSGPLSISNVQIVGLGSHFLSIDGNGQNTVFNINDGDSTISHLIITGGMESAGVVIAMEATLLIDHALISNNASGGINNNGSLTVTNSKLSGNLISNSNVSGIGGAIRNDGTMVLANSIISANTAGSSGGGIYSSGSLTVTNCMLSGNSVSYAGGGICNNGTLTVSDSTILGNSASSGGAISNYGTMTVVSSTISTNSASNGGGIRNNGQLTLANSTISDNLASSSGGGIYNSGTMAVVSSTISANLADSSGGGIYNTCGTLTVTNSTLSANSTNNIGGGIHNIGGTLMITNSTLSSNSSKNNGGGIYSSASFSLTILNNTLVARNEAVSGPDIFLYDGIWSGSHNLIGNGMGQTYLIDGENDNIVGSSENPIDSFFKINPSHGGDGWGDNPDTPDIDESLNDDYGDLQLAYGSPAINAGSNELAVDAQGNPLATDIAGNPRIINRTVDIGAYESSEPARLPGDANLDKAVTNADALIVSGNWLMQSGATWADGDFNGDGRVDGIDATLLAANLHTTPDPPDTSPTAATEPEAGHVSCDLDNDGHVGLGDLALFASVYREKPGLTTENPCAYAADFDRSGTVDLGDLALFAADYHLGRSDASIASTAEVSQSNLTAPETTLTVAEIPAKKTTILLPGDANLDGTVNDDDADSLASNWQKAAEATWTEGDFNSDGRVDDADASLLAMHWLMNVDNLDDDGPDSEKDAAHDLFFDMVV